MQLLSKNVIFHQDTRPPPPPHPRWQLCQCRRSAHNRLQSFSISLFFGTKTDSRDDLVENPKQNHNNYYRYKTVVFVTRMNGMGV